MTISQDRPLACAEIYVGGLWFNSRYVPVSDFMNSTWSSWGYGCVQFSVIYPELTEIKPKIYTLTYHCLPLHTIVILFSFRAYFL